MASLPGNPPGSFKIFFGDIRETHIPLHQFFKKSLIKKGRG
jgi:hypothetical protein